MYTEGQKIDVSMDARLVKVETGEIISSARAVSYVKQRTWVAFLVREIRQNDREELDNPDRIELCVRDLSVKSWREKIGINKYLSAPQRQARLRVFDSVEFFSGKFKYKIFRRETFAPGIRCPPKVLPEWSASTTWAWTKISPSLREILPLIEQISSLRFEHDAAGIVPFFDWS